MKFKEYYRPDEVMEKLNISKATFYRWIRDPQDPLPARQKGKHGSIRIPIKEFEEWEKKKTVDVLNLNK